MTPTAESRLGSLADSVLALVGGRADEASVTVAERRQGLTRFANSAIHQNVGDEHTAVSLTVVVGGRVATATTSQVGDVGSLRRLVDATLSAARVQPVDPGWPGVGPPVASDLDLDGGWDEATAAAGPGERAGVVAAFVAAAAGLVAAGYCETTAESVLVATTAGRRIASSATTATVDGIARAGRCDGVGSTRSTRLADLDGAGSGSIAAASARSTAAGTPVDLPPGRYEVVLSPRCVAYMLDFLTVYGVNGRAVAEDRSYVRPGEVQLDERLSIVDDAGDPRQTGLRIDAEGTPKRRTELVARGRSVGVTEDRRTAMEAGTTSTGHAVAGGAGIGAIATNVVLSGTDPQPAPSLTAGVERGLLVRDFWYARVLEPRSLVVTGLTRNGVWLIEDGVVTAPVPNLRFTQSPVAAWGPGQVLGVGDDPRLAPGGLHVSSHLAPSLRLASWHFSGGAAG